MGLTLLLALKTGMCECGTAETFALSDLTEIF